MITRPGIRNSRTRLSALRRRWEVHRRLRTIWTIAVQGSGAATKAKNPKSEIRNPKQIQIGGEREMKKTGGGGLSANFANFREFSGGEF
jgi:hypothetical protein